MPYKSNSDLPDRIKDNLPKHAQDIYREAYNHAWDEYSSSKKRRGNESQEQVSHKVAWSAVEQKYKKDGDKWVAI